MKADKIACAALNITGIHPRPWDLDVLGKVER